MLALIIVIIGSILFLFDIISGAIFMPIVIACLVGLIVGPLLYGKFGLLKFYYHDILKWHVPDDSPRRYDGCSEHATCKYCGADIMQDSQGNWF